MLLLGGGTLAALPSGELARPARALAVLTRRAFGVLAAVAARVVTAPGADPVAIAHGVDDALAWAAPETQGDVVSLLMLFENALPGLLFDGRVLPFTRLSPERQDAVLDAWRRSSLVVRRSGYTALRKLCAAAHYAEPATWAAFGYPAPPRYAIVSDDSSFGAAP